MLEDIKDRWLESLIADSRYYEGLLKKSKNVLQAVPTKVVGAASPCSASYQQPLLQWWKKYLDHYLSSKSSSGSIGPLLLMH